MRLTEHQRRTIRHTVQETLGSGVEVRLFGSRVDDGKRGGDIDLYLAADRPIENKAIIASRIAAKLQIALGDQKIDVVLVDPQTPEQRIHRVAREKGVVI
ncbi:MAG: nucleotidyltransferase domain-containing protein [Pseudomonadales bacterium]